MQGCRKMLEKWKQGGWEKDRGVSRDRGSFRLSVQFYGVDRADSRSGFADLATFTPRVPLPGPSRATLSRLCFLKQQPHFLRTETMTLLSLT